MSYGGKLQKSVSVLLSYNSQLLPLIHQHITSCSAVEALTVNKVHCYIKDKTCEVGSEFSLNYNKYELKVTH